MNKQEHLSYKAFKLSAFVSEICARPKRHNKTQREQTLGGEKKLANVSF
jgi:hypothetical protein